MIPFVIGVPFTLVTVVIAALPMPRPSQALARSLGMGRGVDPMTLVNTSLRWRTLL
ncbi:MAG TPA: hypothetical protein VM450_11125 [Thermomicrobiales bacterium]|nr:hypothetical protein [Thermomicrobiales bacterium]